MHATLQVTVSVCRSVGWLVCPTLLFFVFLGFLKVGKHILEYLESYEQHLRLYKSPCWSVGPSVRLSRFAFFAFFRLFKGREAHIKVFSEFQTTFLSL